MRILDKYIASGTYYMLKAIYKSKEEKNMILDPLTCIIRLAILKYKPEGTKISISGNRVYFQTPGVSQSISRWIFSDKRSDLSNLHNPILKATEWFVDHNSVELNGLFKLASEGLLRLQSTYGKNTLTSHALNDYVEIINRWLSDKPQKETSVEFNPMEDEINQELKQLSQEKESIGRVRRDSEMTNMSDQSYENHLDLNHDSESIDTTEESDKSDNQGMSITSLKDLEAKRVKVSSTIHQQLKTLWNEKEIQAIFNLFDEIEKHNYSDRNNLLGAIEIILEMKENYVMNLIKEVSTIL